MAPHYYDRTTGLLLPSVEIKSGPNQGSYREPDLRDARKVNGLTSATTYLSLLDKPGIHRWSVEQGIKAALGQGTGQWYDAAEIDELTPALYIKSQEFMRYTQDWGTSLHDWVNRKLSVVESISIPPLMPGSEECADALLEWFDANGFEWELTEHRFFRPDLGWAGTADLIGTYYGDPVIADLKTQSKPLTPYDPEMPLQLAAYAMGCDLPDETLRLSIIVDRDQPGNVLLKLWQDNARYDKAFLQLVDLWCLLHQYDPRTTDA